MNLKTSPRLKIRDNPGWLRYRVEKTLSKKHKILNPTLKKSIVDFCDSYFLARNKYFVIVLLILTYYTISLFFTWFDCFDITVKTAQTIIDHRSANLAAIIAMSIAVVGFLISNIAVKDPYGYQLLFNRSRLYPIIYFTLTTIGTLIIISTLRDAIKSEFIYSRLVVAGTYLALTVLILIGYLFRKIIHYTNSKKMHEIAEEELLIEAKRDIRERLVKEYGRYEYHRYMRLIGALEYDPMNAIILDNIEVDQNFVEQNQNEMLNAQRRIVQDIDLHALNVFIYPKKRNNEVVYFQRLALDTNTTQSDNYVWSHDIENNEIEKRMLKRILKLRPEKEKIRNSDVKKYFEDKVDEFTEANKYKSLKPFLDSYIRLYSLEMTNRFILQ